MTYEERQELIQALEAERDSRVITYFLGDRPTHPKGLPGFQTGLATEPMPQFIDALRAIGDVENIDLFLYTRGGNTDSVWPLVSTIREHCENLRVLVPFRAHSGGTLICLAADEIVMAPHAELSPIDPTTGNQFNPQDPNNPANRFGISVEDVAAFFALAEERAGAEDTASTLEVFKELTNEVHPLALGNVQRVYQQIRYLAKKLMGMHMDVADERANRIVEALTVEFYSHVHAISRREANELLGEPWVSKGTENVQRLMWEMYNQYASELRLREKFNLPEYMGDEQSRRIEVKGGFIETTSNSFAFITKLRCVQRPKLPQGVQLQAAPNSQMQFPGWAGRDYEVQMTASGWKETVNNE